jgi:hypothetical protein
MLGSKHERHPVPFARTESARHRAVRARRRPFNQIQAMNCFHFLRTLAATAACVSLAACGGGGDDDGPPSDTPSLAACFGLTPGHAFTVTSGERRLAVSETFNGVQRTGFVQAQSSGLRTFATYWSVEPNGVRFWGANDYGESAANPVTSRIVYSDGYLLPLALQPGQSATLTYTETITEFNPPNPEQVSTVTSTDPWTFEAFDTLTLGGRTFNNLCRMRITFPGGSSQFWVAPGFGVIRNVSRDAAGTVVEEEALSAVISP